MTSPTSPDLSQRRIVVPGGDTAVGRGIVEALLAAGGTVILPTTDPVGAADRAGHGCLHRMILGAEELSSAQQLATRAAEFGPITDVVDALGDRWSGKGLWQVDEDEWASAFVDPLTRHLAVLRAFLPGLPGDGTYTVVLSDRAMTPTAGSGLDSMGQAALLMMHRVLAAEVGTQRRVHSMVLGPLGTDAVEPATGTDRRVSPDEVGALVVELVGHPQLGSLEVGLRTREDVRAAAAAIERAVASANTVNREDA